MQNTLPADTHPTVTEFIKRKTPTETIRIGFTDQKVSGRAGRSAFARFLHWHQLSALLAKALPHRPTRPNALPPEDLARGCIAGLLAGAQKLAHVAHLRGEPGLPALRGIKRVGSQSTFSRFFQGFDRAPGNTASLGHLGRWCLERVAGWPGGYSLELDSPRLLHEDGPQEGVAAGDTRLGIKPGRHLLLAGLAEAKLVVGFWLRAGNSVGANNVGACIRELLERLPHHLRRRVVRADSGFGEAGWLDFLEERQLKCLVVARLLRPLQTLLQQQTWTPPSVPGTPTAAVWHQEIHGPRPRRMILIRHPTAERLARGQRPGGKPLFDGPGYPYQAWVTNFSEATAALELGRDYNQRAGGEEVSQQRDHDFALPHLWARQFWGTAAALSLAVFSYNLCPLFQRRLGWWERVTAATLRFRLFITGGIISRRGGRTTLRRRVPQKERPWWVAICTKLQSTLPHGDAVGQPPG